MLADMLLEAEVDVDVESVELVEVELDGLVEVVMLYEGVPDPDTELDSVLDSLVEVDVVVEADVDVDADGDGLLEVVSEVLSEVEVLELGVTSDERDKDELGDSLLEGV